MFSLIHAGRALEDRVEGALAGAELSLAKFGVLSELANARSPLPLSELAARLSCVRSNMTQLVDRLEADGLVKRVSDSDDRRVVRAAITPLGTERHAIGARELERVQGEFSAALSATDRDALEKAVSDLG
ncbi:MAG TPA: MarR family transcriptional regulator [Gemmatimonadaceae bacterium]|nr:MarR family transcriptional regulator [Gemmatimonadaceae bacterium]